MKFYKRLELKNPKISPLYQYIRTFSELSAPSGAGEGISGVLFNLFNDQNEEAKLLAYQLEFLETQTNSEKFII